MDDLTNIVISPISINEGMAGSKRLFNLFYYLKDDKKYKLYNFYFSLQRKSYRNKKIISKCLSSNYYTFHFLLLFKLLKKQKRNKKILYYYGQPDISNFWFFPIIKLLGYKVVFDIVEDYSNYKNFHSISQKIRIKTKVFFSKRIKHFCDAIITINEYLNKLYQHINKPQILLPISYLEKNYMNGNNNYKNKKIKIFYGGSYEYKDDIENLISSFDEIYKKNKNIELHLTGKGFKNINEKLENITESREGIIYHGYINDNKYFELINSCDILCVPRKNIGFALSGYPFKFGEFMFSGNVVLASKIKSLTKDFSDKELCFYDPQIKGDLRRKIEFLINNPEERYKIGQRGKSKAKELFNSKEHAKLLKNFINSL